MIDLDQRLAVGEDVAEPILSRDSGFSQLAAGQRDASCVAGEKGAIARALILEPTLLVADDPTAGIDVTVRGTVLEILHDLHEDRRFSALIVSHTMSEVRQFRDRV